jgi:hypothetical protein
MLKTVLSLLSAIGIVFVFVPSVFASAFTPLATDTLSWASGELEINGNSAWAASGTSMTYEVARDFMEQSLWRYRYTFTVPQKAISHIIIETSRNFEPANMQEGTTVEGREGPEAFEPMGASNPGLPEDLYGMKWNPSGNPFSYTVTIVTDRGPQWGDFYAKDGKVNLGGGVKVDVWAYSAGFTSADTDPFLDVMGLLTSFHVDDTTLTRTHTNGFTFVTDHILVPDTVATGGGGDCGGGCGTETPEPSTVLLVSSGLVALGLWSRRKSRLDRGVL